jgi:release factor glutamine methyltransferase
MVFEEFERNARKQVELAGHSTSESKAIVKELIFQHFGWNSTQFFMYSKDHIEELDLNILSTQIEKINSGMPTQYVTAKAAFCGLELKVNSSVLIPRPETEELIQHIFNRTKPKRILDIGTGSGAIALALKNKFTKAEVVAIDFSSEALKVAEENAFLHSLDVTFLNKDMSQFEDMKDLGKFDLVISNPPYIPLDEKESLSSQVLDYEPHLALFSPQDDPIYFYKCIGISANFLLLNSGFLALELHPPTASKVESFLVQQGFDVEVIKDLAGRSRFILGQKRV